jgi:hypothetical protein
MDESKKLRLLLNVYLDSVERSLNNLEAILLICNSIQQYRLTINDKFDNERLQNSNLLFQKAFLHGHSIKTLAQGIDIVNLKTSLSVKINDPLSLHILFRGLLETYLTFYLINVLQPNDKAKEIMHLLWLYHGLYQRQKADFSNSVKKEEAEVKLSTEKKILDNLELQIRSSTQFKNLNPRSQELFFKQIKHNWKISFKNDSYSSLGYQDVIKATSLRHDLFTNFYNYFSWDSHSTCISVFQLRGLYENGYDEKLVATTVGYTFFFLSFMTYDLIINDPNYIPCYQRLPQDLKDLLNFYNIYLRGDEFSLEKHH